MFESPRRVIPLDYAQPIPGGRWFSTVRWLTLITLIICAVALVAILIEVRSVVVSGPTIFTLGILILLGGLRLRAPAYILMGIGHCGICLLFFLCVNILNWGPNQAWLPFIVMGTIYCIVSFLPLIITFRKPFSEIGRSD